MRPKRKIVIAAIVLAVLLALVLLYENNQTIVLRLNGFEKNRTMYATSGSFYQGGMYAVPISHTTGNRVMVGYMTQNRLGLWKMEAVTTSSYDDGRVSLSWAVPLYWSKTTPDEEVDEFSYHYICAGLDAINQIESIDTFLPENVTADFFQIEHYYFVTVRSTDLEALNGLNIYEKLEDAGYIRASE